MSVSKRVAIGAVSAAAIAAILVYVVGLARAAGVPTMPPVMTYSGTLTDPTGAPLTGSKNLQLQLWSQASGGTALCMTPSAAQTLVAGTFQIALPDTCVAAVHASGDLWTEIIVDGASLGRTKIGAVPYALEAGTAASAAGALDTRLNALVPPKSIIMANLTAADIANSFDLSGLGTSGGPYAGWAICNGGNGTPNLANRFVRVSAVGAGATGGNDSAAHTHPIDHDHPGFNSGEEGGHTHTTPAHAHTIPIGFDASNYYWSLDNNGTPLFGSGVTTLPHFTVPVDASNYGVGPARLAYTETSGNGTTAGGSPHAHSVDPPPFGGTSGPASATDNRPAYYELLALMRL